MFNTLTNQRLHSIDYDRFSDGTRSPTHEQHVKSLSIKIFRHDCWFQRSFDWTKKHNLHHFRWILINFTVLRDWNFNCIVVVAHACFCVKKVQKVRKGVKPYFGWINLEFSRAKAKRVHKSARYRKTSKMDSVPMLELIEFVAGRRRKRHSTKQEYPNKSNKVDRKKSELFRTF